jgi:hypothetical protein
MLRMLDNPLYAGLIRLPAFEGRPEKYVKALHEAIIPENIFWTVHELIKGRHGQRAQPKKQTSHCGESFVAIVART